MDYIYFYFILYSVSSILKLASAHTFSVKIGTDQHVNVVDKQFLSFTVDPKYLFSNTDKYNSKECLCMATSLSPAYLRIAGPSTDYMSFRNSSISIEDLEPDDLDVDLDLEHHRNVLDKLLERRSATIKRQVREKVTVSSNQWVQFAKWAKATGFELVFALNNDVKTQTGMWDPNTALDILTVAEKVKVGKMYWQLGYECNNQSIEEYLNDLETLRLIVETFPSGSENKWKVVGGDVTNCLQAESKSDFKDYVTLSVDMLDAVLLNSNSSSHELERMSEYDRLKLLKLLSESDTPLWITEITRRQHNELERAANWMASLGYSARNGFSVHYRELLKEELFEPTLSFYMALLFKNLVGERVLEVESSQAVIFAHCTSLRHKPVHGAVTLYAVNMEDEPARFSIKLSKREEGGDVMQFILGHDQSGNIVVNGRAMYYEGDIKPIVKRVRPYKTLLINLPPKSFGFWVLANTKVDACYNTASNSNNTLLVEAVDVSDINNATTNKIQKRAINIEDFDDLNITEISEDFSDNDEIPLDMENADIKNRIEDLNIEFKKVRKLFEHNFNAKKGIDVNLRKKRQINSEENEGKHRKFKKHIIKPKYEIKKILDEFKNKALIGNILPLSEKLHNHKYNRFDKQKRKDGIRKFNKNKDIKQTSKNIDYKIKPTIENADKNSEKLSRHRRNVVYNEKSKLMKDDTEKVHVNEIDTDVFDNSKLWKILHKMQKQLNELQLQNENKYNEDDKSGENGQILVKTKVFDDGASINLSEHPNHGLIKTTVENMFSVLGELNTNLNRFWGALTLLD